MSSTSGAKTLLVVVCCRTWILKKRSFRHSVRIYDAQFAVYFAPVPDRHRPPLCGFEGSQIERFQKRLITRKHAPLAVQLAVCGIQTLDGVGRVDDCPNGSRKLKDRGYHIPVLNPGFHCVRIFSRPFFCNFIAGFSTHLFCRRLVDALQVFRERLFVFVRNVLQRIADLMDYAALILSMRKSCGNSIFDSCQIISTYDHYILYTTVLELIQNGQPVLGAFVLPNVDCQNIFLSFKADPKNNIRC